MKFPNSVLCAVNDALVHQLADDSDQIYKELGSVIKKKGAEADDGEAYAERIRWACNLTAELLNTIFDTFGQVKEVQVGKRKVFIAPFPYDEHRSRTAGSRHLVSS